MKDGETAEEPSSPGRVDNTYDRKSAYPPANAPPEPPKDDAPPLGEAAPPATATATDGAPKKKGGHRATYARDKRNPGGYLIRVTGPTAQAFAGRSVPVTRKDDSESQEKLVRCVWAGVDEESAKPVALYTFEQKPKKEADPDDLPF